MPRKTYWVRYIAGRWAVRQSEQTLSSHTTKDAAIDAGVRIAKANQPSSLKICRMDGTIEDERTYGDDPYPPAGLIRLRPPARAGPPCGADPARVEAPQGNHAEQARRPAFAWRCLPQEVAGVTGQPGQVSRSEGVRTSRVRRTTFTRRQEKFK